MSDPNLPSQPPQPPQAEPATWPSPPPAPPVPPAPMPPPAPPIPQGPGTRTSSNAVVALVLSIATWVLCWLPPFSLIPAIIALVFASKGDREIRESGGLVTGSGLVTAARIVSWIAIGVTVALLVLGLVLLLVFAIGGAFDGGMGWNGGWDGGWDGDGPMMGDEF